MRIALVSRALHPFSEGGIGVTVAGMASALSEIADVLVLTSSAHEERYRQLKEEGDLTLPPEVQVEFVPEPAPGDFGSYYGSLHLYSARVLERLRERYGDRGPDIVEFPDFLGEGLVTVQARRGHEPFLQDTQVHVRLHTSAEMRGVLDGFVDDAPEARHMLVAERHVLREADRILWPGGDVLGTYQRFYGDAELAPASRVRAVIAASASATSNVRLPSAEEGIRLLFLGDLARREGVQDLVQALGGVHSDAWSLTLVGADTDTAPLSGPMRDQLERASAGDPRIQLVGPASRSELAELIAGSHVVVCPSRWACWPAVVLEALAAGRPVLGTPTGGLVELLASYEAGWLTEDVGQESLARAIESLLDQPVLVDELIASGGPRRVFARLNDPDTFRAEYLVAAQRRESIGGPARGSASRAGRSERLVSVVIPYSRSDRTVEETIGSVFDQSHRQVEVIVVSDGYPHGDDDALEELAASLPVRVLTQLGGGPARARNAGIAQSRGPYVLPLDPDILLRPGFIRRCLDVLERDRGVAFATTWSQYVDERGRELNGLASGSQPIGNRSPGVLNENIAGSAAALIRKRVFDLGHWYSPELRGHEHWQLYRELHSAGLYGHAIPERLLLYRVRTDSPISDLGPSPHARLQGEMTADLREKEMTWKSRSG